MKCERMTMKDLLDLVANRDYPVMARVSAALLAAEIDPRDATAEQLESAQQAIIKGDLASDLLDALDTVDFGAFVEICDHAISNCREVALENVIEAGPPVAPGRGPLSLYYTDADKQSEVDAAIDYAEEESIARHTAAYSPITFPADL